MSLFKTKRTDWYTQISCPIGKAFFGKKVLEYESLFAKFPDIEFLKLKQVHSADVIPANSESKPADGHFTKQKDIACLIQTADCMPIVFMNRNVCFGVHAGWRGVEQNIIAATAKVMNEQGFDLKSFFVMIGPHIQKDSFEVGVDVAEKLTLATPENHRIIEQFVIPHSDPEKKFVDLDYIALAQLQDSGYSMDQVWISQEDTTKDPVYHSYRRDRTPGRQWSFGLID